MNLFLVFAYSALAAASSPLGVIGGSLAGHGVATLVRVPGAGDQVTAGVINSL